MQMRMEVVTRSIFGFDAFLHILARRQRGKDTHTSVPIETIKIDLSYFISPKKIRAHKYDRV